MSKTRKKKTWKAPPTRGKSKLAGKAPKSLKASSKANGKAKVGKGRTKSVEAQGTLPGYEQIPIVKLDNICRSVRSERVSRNLSALNEKGLTQSALQIMQKEGVDFYVKHGVELELVTGATKIKVHLVDENTAPVARSAKTGKTAKPEPETEETGNEDLDGLGDGSQSTEIH